MQESDDVVKWSLTPPRTWAKFRSRWKWRIYRWKKRLILWLLSLINPIQFPNRGDISPEVTMFFLKNEYAHYFSSDAQTSRILTCMLEEFKRLQDAKGKIKAKLHSEQCSPTCQFAYLRENDGRVPCCKTWRDDVSTQLP